MVTTKERGDEAEDQALAFLQGQGLRLIKRNYRLAHGPRMFGGEIDLIMQGPQGLIVFVEVRARKSSKFGGAGASISFHKRKSMVYAAQQFLMRYRSPPACRFDVLLIEAYGLEWLPGAFALGLD